MNFLGCPRKVATYCVTYPGYNETVRSWEKKLKIVFASKNRFQIIIIGHEDLLPHDLLCLPIHEMTMVRSWPFRKQGKKPDMIIANGERRCERKEEKPALGHWPCVLLVQI